MLWLEMRGTLGAFRAIRKHHSRFSFSILMGKNTTTRVQVLAGLQLRRKATHEGVQAAKLKSVCRNKGSSKSNILLGSALGCKGMLLCENPS